MKNKIGFTLVELLVVVLIVGVLAAVALPQYQKTIEKSKAVQAKTLLSALDKSVKVYFLNQGTYPVQLDELPIQIPAWAGTDHAFISTSHWKEWHAAKDWNVAYYNGDGNVGVRMERLSGKYRGAFFQWNWMVKEDQRSFVPENKVFCGEISPDFKPSEGSYCQKIFHGTKTSPAGRTTRVYQLP